MLMGWVAVPSSCTPLRRLLLTLRFSKRVLSFGCLFPAMVISKGHRILSENGGRSARLPNLPCHGMADPSSRFSGLDPIALVTLTVIRLGAYTFDQLSSA